MPEYKKVEWNKRTRKGYEISVDSSGTTYYTLDGKKHRKDGPAVIWRDGYKAWYLNNKLHREDGPAVIWLDGRKEWWLKGRYLSRKDFKSIDMIRKMQASELFTIQELAKMRLGNTP